MSTRDPSRTPLDAGARLRRAMAAYPTGIALVAAQAEHGPVGMLMNSLTSVSLEPPLVSLAFSTTSPTWQLLDPLPVWGISILGGTQGLHETTQLSRPGTSRFDGLDLTVTADGAVLLPDAVATFVVRRHRDLEAGDHMLALLEVLDSHRGDGTALLFHDSNPLAWQELRR